MRIRHVVAAAVALAALVGCAPTSAEVAPEQPARAGQPHRAVDRGTHRPWTRAALRHVLADAPVPPSGTVRSRPPVAALRGPSQQVASPNRLALRSWWVVPGTTASVLAYLRSHTPPGLTRNGSGTGLGPAGRVDSVMYDGPDTAAYTGLMLVVDVARDGSQTAVRATVQAIWLPARSSAGTVPADVTAVDVVVRRPQAAPTVRRTLGPDVARRLAAVVDALPVLPPGVRSCPLGRGFRDLLTFHAGDHVVPVVVQDGGCGAVQVHAGGPGAPALEDGSRVDHLVLRALGLPAGYCWSR